MMICTAKEMLETLLNKAIEASLLAGAAIVQVYHSHDHQVETKEDQSPLTLADRRAHEIIVSYLSEMGLPLLSEEGRAIPYNERNQWEAFWMVDPLDGTKEFIRRNGEFTVNIALIMNHVPVLGVVYAPVMQQLYYGMEGLGAFCLDPCPSDISITKVHELSALLPHRNHDRPYRVVASRSHLSLETELYIQHLVEGKPFHELVSRGSSLKLCMVADGSADVYPRFAPTMEWDTAAGHAVIVASGGKVMQADGSGPLAYNKENLLNPWFIAYDAIGSSDV